EPSHPTIVGLILFPPPRHRQPPGANGICICRGLPPVGCPEFEKMMIGFRATTETARLAQRKWRPYADTGRCER
ncbi:hypothetical protein BaRGS_00038738, partial [Batillaria attramentaria]